MQHTISGGKPLQFLPEEHTDFIFVIVPEEIPWLVAGIVLIAGAGTVWWLRRRGSHRAV